MKISFRRVRRTLVRQPSARGRIEMQQLETYFRQQSAVLKKLKSGEYIYIKKAISLLTTCDPSAGNRSRRVFFTSVKSVKIRYNFFIFFYKLIDIVYTVIVFPHACSQTRRTPFNEKKN